MELSVGVRAEMEAASRMGISLEAWYGIFRGECVELRHLAWSLRQEACIRLLRKMR